MNTINPNTIRTYVNKLEQKGYSSEEILRKLHTTSELLSWAYQNDHLSYSEFQQAKDEIANFKARFEGLDLHKAQSVLEDSENVKNDEAQSLFNKIAHRIPFYRSNKVLVTDKNKSSSNITEGFRLNPQYYVGMVFVLVIMAILGAGIYERFFKSTANILAYPSAPSAASRILSFQGRLTDSLGNPITAATNMRFRLYTASSGGTTLYDTGTCSITPDQDGVHNVLIGSSCGSEVSSSVFTENTQVWLGVLVGSDAEMTPRQRMANVPYAMNAETLQGLPVGTEVSTIPYINAGGDLLMAAASPQIGSTYTNQDFLISSARALTIQAAGAGDVTLTATESGTIKFATGGSQHGVITNTGLFGFGSTGPDGKLDVLYTGGEQLRLTYADGSTYTGFTTNSGGDLTIDPSGDDVTIGGDLILADTFTVQVGGKTATAYNAFANSGDAPESGSITSDNDVYIGGDLEVDGSIVGTVSPGFTQGSVVFTDGSGNLAQDNASFFFDDTNNLLGIGTASPVGKLHITGAVTGKALSIFNETGDQNIITASASGTTVANLDRSGNLAIEGAISDLGGTTLAINDNLDVSGTLFVGTADAFQVDTSGNITAVGTTLSGDIAVNGGDITSTASTFNLSIANAGTINFKDGTNTLVAIKDQGVYPFLNLAGKTDTGDPGTCAEGDIYYNDTDDTIKVCHESNSWEALDSAVVGSQWTDGGTTVYLTDTTDELVIGGSSPLSSSKVSIDGDADQIQFIVQGNATQTSNLATFEQSDGTDVFTITNAGNLTAAGDLAVNGDDITSDSNLTLNATGYTRIGDTASPGSANGDDDLFVEGDLEIDGVFYLDGTLDTAFTAGSVVFAGASGVLAQDNANFFWDDTNNKFGLGDTTPDAKFEISGAATGKALTILNETGDQDIIAASASGVTRFRVGNDGTVYGGYFADMSNNAYGIDPAGTSNFGGYSLKVTGGALLAADAGNVGIGDQTPDAKLNVLATTEQLRLDYDDSNYTSFTVGSSGDLTIAPTGSDTNITGNLAISGGTTIGDASGDTVTANAAAWTFANDTTVALSGGVNGINFDSNTLSIDATNNRIGIGIAAPTSQLHVSKSLSSIADYTTELLSLNDLTLTAAGNIGSSLIAQRNNATFSAGSGTQPSVYGTYNYAHGTGASTITNAYGSYNVAAFDSGAINTNSYASYNNTHIEYGATLTNAYGDYSAADFFGGGTITNRYGYYAANPVLIGGGGTNTIANNYGIYVAAQNYGSTSDVGLYIGDADTYSLQLASTDGDAASGITFGTDTNLYRSAADTLKTDDAFFAVGSITTSGDLAVNGDDITADGALTLNSASYTRVGDTASPGSANGDDDLFVEGDLEIDGVFYADGGVDTAFTAGSVVFAGTSGVLAQDNASFFWDDSSNELGIGTVAPAATLDVLDTTEQLRLSYDASNYSAFTVGSSGDLTIAPSGGDLAITGNGDFSGGLNVATSNHFNIDTSGNVGIGTTAASGYGLRMVKSIDMSTLSTYYQQHNSLTYTGSAIGSFYFGSGESLTNSGSSAGPHFAATVQGFSNSSTAWTGSSGYGLWGGASNAVAANNNYLIGARMDLTNSSTGTGQVYTGYWALTSNSTTGTIASATGFSNSVINSSSGTISASYAFLASSPSNASGTITTAYGLNIADQSVGTNTTAYGVYIANQSGSSGNAIGLYIADADDYSIQLASTDGDAASGITFGTDTNLYRNGANTLHTDDSFDIDGNLVVDGSVDANGQVDLGDGGDTLTLNGTTVSITNTGAGNDITINAVDQVVLTDFTGGGTGCSALETDGSGNLTCGSDAGGATAWDDIIDPDAAGSIAFAEYAQTMDWDLATDVAKTALSLTFTNDVAGSNTQYLLNLDNLNDGGANGLTESLLVLDNSDANEAVTDGILFVNAGGGFTDFIDTPSSVFKVDGSGNITGVAATLTGDIAVNGDDITADGALTLNSASYVRVGDTASPGSATGDDDLFVESDLEVDGVVYLDGTLDTTLTAGSVFFAGTNGVLTQDNSSLFFDDTNNRLGIGDTTPDAFLDITGTTAQLRLSYETTDTNYTTFTTSSGGDLTIAPSGSDTAITGNVDISGTLKAGTSDAFQVDASGNVIGNDRSMGGEFSGVDGYGDSGSMIANGSVELDLNTGGLPDGWAHDTGSHDGTRSSSGSYNGDYHYRIDAETAENGFQTSCFPVSDAQTYYLDLYAKAASGTTSHMDLNYIEYSTRADCEADSAAGIGGITTGLTTTSSWAEFGGSYSPEPDIRWLKFEIENNDTSGATNQDLYIDAVRVWYNTTNGAGGLDLAETYPINKNEQAQVAEIVSFGTSEKQNGADVKNIKKSSGAYDNNAFGVTATQPGLVLDDNGTYNKIKVALKGRVPVLVTTENGPIKVGDPITASSKPGIGMKATRSGRIVGYAMSEWTSSDPNEIDQVVLFVNPETYVDLSILTQLQESVAKFPSMTASVLTQADSILINTAEAALLKTESLIATTIKATNATIDNLIVDRIVSREITSVTVKTETLQAQNIEAKDATFSGKLVAQEIDADNIRELRDRLERLSVEQNSEPAFDSAGLQEEVENIQNYLEDLSEQEDSPSLPVNEIVTNTSIDPGTTTSITGEQINMMNLENLTVTGTAAMASLAIADSFTAGNIFIKDNSVLSLSNELKLSALEQVNIMDGAVIIAKNGTITAKGEVIAEKGVRTNTIKPLDTNSAVGIQLSQNKVEVLNNNSVVAAINNDGSAKFKDVSVDTYTEATGSAVIIAAEDNYDENGILSPGIQTNATAAGNGIIPAKNDTIVIFNDTISAKSLVYVTATSKTFNQNLYVAEKKSCTPEEKIEDNCKPYFTVHIDGAVKDAITFNWWIVN